ncbi:hypothetical protein [Paenibacillus cremeus]|uniref:Uncharacterized protein n=1 Tax=Paenibacillus cremeus TaxID=2163881 RepID=A0A559KCS9_9BACL|nr:hypothetical protein [Paenibacillus cremeus]TVY09946.1 hypothetical protein FPZ49_11280 [Paenibacillus cremeus]
MEVITAMAVVALGLKVAVALGSVVGITSGVNWFNKKTINLKGSGKDEGKHESLPRFHRDDIE